MSDFLKYLIAFPRFSALMGRLHKAALNPVLKDDFDHLTVVCNHAIDFYAASAAQDAIVENIAAVLCSIDAQGRLNAVSPSSKTMLGYSQEALWGPHVSIMFSEEHKDLAKMAILRRISDSNNQPFIATLRKVDGTDIKTLWSVVVAGDSSSTLICAIQDISKIESIENIAP